ncbi:hypothetical protein R3P38DRAFT_2618518 [Favolaschia claudopus]|uniref:Uncharacterized protein n=1 Tax=Favolaschia claudopus TaxID=2862362 RepID=A0AAW0C2W7_9AGAR
MTTVVDRPISAFGLPSISSIIPRRRSRDSVEVIDVDSLEDSAVVDTRPTQRRRVEPERDIIELLDDSDEEDVSIITSTMGASGSGGESECHFPELWSVRGVGVETSNRPRNFVSPPPPQFDHTIPPVPSVPHRYSAFTSFPLPRPRPARIPVPSNAGASSSSAVPRPVRASSQPFAFEIPSSPLPEADPAPRPGPSRRTHHHHHHEHSDDDDFDFRPAPRARHNPPMGLGGALISYNNARQEAERRDRERRNERRAAGGRIPPAIALTGVSGSRIGSGQARRPGVLQRLMAMNPWRWGDDLLGDHDDVEFLAVNSAAEDGDLTRGDAQLALDLYLQDHEDRFNSRFGPPARGFARRELAILRGFRGGRAAADEEENYRAEWTHPGSADPGFVFDFAPSEIVPAVEGNGKGKAKEVVIDVDAEKEAGGGVSTLLVCAKCLDPLLVRADGIMDGGEEEAKKRKVWGLRCGHLIDGKCFEELRRPAEAVEAASGSGDDAPPPSTDTMEKGKGKGKANELEVDEEHDHDHDHHDDLEDGSSSSIPDTSSIRARLRPRGPAAGSMPGGFPPPVFGEPPAFSIAAPLPPPPPAPSRRRPQPKRKGKGKAKPKKPVVEEEWRWYCPVAGCAREHVSQKIEGVWVNAPERGAIGVFV